MSISNGFKQMVANINVPQIRIVMKNSLVSDPTSAQFDEYMRYAKSLLGNIYNIHDGENLRTNPAEWSMEYLEEQMNKVVDNFSRERISLLQDMCHHYYGKPPQDTAPQPEPAPMPRAAAQAADPPAEAPPQPDTAQTPPPSQAPPQSHRAHRPQRPRREIVAAAECDPLATALLLCGTAVAITGAVVSKPVVFAVGAVTAVAGGLIALSNPQQSQSCCSGTHGSCRGHRASKHSSC